MISKPILGYEEKYLIYEDGRVYSIKRSIFLKSQIEKFGYVKVELNNISPKKFMIHRLVATAFIPNNNNLPQVNHIDGNKKNNHVSNLEWVTQGENIRHAISIGLRPNIKGEGNFNSTLTEVDVLKIRKLCSDGVLTQIQIGKLFNMDQRNISRIYKRKLWKHI